MATDYRELKRLADDPQAARALADLLLTHRADLLSDSAQDLLASLKKRAGEKELTMRQLEALLDIRDRSTVSNKVGPYSLRTLLRRSWEARDEIPDEQDVEWLRKCIFGHGDAGLLTFVAAVWLAKYIAEADDSNEQLSSRLLSVAKLLVDASAVWMSRHVERSTNPKLTDAERRRLIAICKSPEIDLIPPDEWVDLRDRRF